MEIYFHDPEDIPLPREEVRIRKFNAAPYPDGRRVKVTLELTPFQERPDAELLILNPEGITVSSASIIETIDPKMEMTLHLEGESGPGTYVISAVLQYRVGNPHEDDNPDEPVRYEILIVDRAEAEFSFP
jgi:hypothetical protein